MAVNLYLIKIISASNAWIQRCCFFVPAAWAEMFAWNFQLYPLYHCCISLWRLVNGLRIFS